MKRVRVLLAVVATVAAMMVFAAPAMAESEMESSGGNSFGNMGNGSIEISGDDLDGGSFFLGSGGFVLD
jgi:hypothetical protein